MGELFRAQVDEVAEKSVRLSLRVVSADVTRLWVSKSFALSLLLEPIVLGTCEPPAALAAVLPRDRIVGLDLAAWKKAASKVVTACTIERVAPSLPDFRAELATLDDTALAALLGSDRTPVARYRIGVKAGMASHLSPGMTWGSAACDLP
ncbi:MAG: hypothetical protein U0234_00780 [Sandaracinus sp.]